MRFLLCAILICISFSVRSQSLTEKYVDVFSTASAYVLTRNGTKPLKNATCFFMKVKNVTYLITNNHVIGGEKYLEEYKRDHKGIAPSKDSLPDNLMVRLYDKRIGFSHFESIGLYDKENAPLFIKFYENPSNPNTLLDVIAIRMDGLNHTKFTYDMVMDSSNIYHELKLYPGCDLFVVGFPRFWGENGNIYPIWKRGTIASEPTFIDFSKSNFMIDATTRGGMSGSPVFFRSNTLPKKDNSMGFSNGIITFLVGIYSAQDYDSEIGVVTNMETIFNQLYAITK